MKITFAILLIQIIRGIKCQNDEFEDPPLFEEATNSIAFVDRTDTLKKFISLPKGCHLVTAPRLFGKSTYMDMMRRFFEMIVDRNGNVVNSFSAQRRRLFTNEKLAVSADKSFVEEHLGRYPVIYLSFHDVQGTSDDEIIDYMIGKVSRVFRRYSWLNVAQATTRTTGFDFITYRFGKVIMENLGEDFIWTTATTPEDVDDYLFDKVLRDEADKEEIVDAIGVLLRLTYKFFRRPVMVFVDAYDAPLTYAIDNSLYSNEILFFTDYLMNAFCKWHAYLDRGLVNGVSNVLRCCKGALTMYMPYYAFGETHSFSYDFVFTARQVDALLQRTKTAKKRRSDITRRYNGYKLTDDLASVYNPYDIIRYVERGALDDYWADANPARVLKPNLRYLTIMDRLTDLLVCKRTNFTVNRRIGLHDFEPFLRLMEGDHTLKGEAHFDIYFTYFLEHGYLSRTPIADFYALPNDETASKFQKEYLDFLYQTYDVTLTENKDIADALDSIVNQAVTTDRAKTTLANALNEILGEDRYRLDYFELQSIILAALYFNSKNRGDLYALGDDKYIDMPYLFSMNRSTLQMASDDGTILLIIRVSFRNKDTTPDEKTRNYVPAVPQNKTKIALVKYLAINTDWEDYAVVTSPRSRRSWIAGKKIRIPKPTTLARDPDAESSSESF